MTRRTGVVCALACLAANLAWADQIVLKNGDRVSGAIVKKDGKNLTIKSDQFGVITTSWDQVESIQTAKPVTVVGPDGKAVVGTISTANGNLQVAGSSIALAQVTAIRDESEQRSYDRLQKPGWTELWSGAGSLGFAGASGNARTLTFTTGINAVRVTRTDKTSLYFNTIKASAFSNGKNADTAQAVRGGLGYDHNVTGRLFVNVFNDYEYDRFQNLDLRFVLGGGLGFHAFKKERSGLDVLAGGDFNRSSYSTPLITKAGEIYWGDEYSLKVNGTTSLVQSFRMFNDMSDTGNYRMNFDVGSSTKIAKWFTWNVSLSDRYLHHPAPGRKTNDLLYSTGLGITFAR